MAQPGMERRRRGRTGLLSCPSAGLLVMLLAMLSAIDAPAQNDIAPKPPTVHLSLEPPRAAVGASFVIRLRIDAVDPAELSINLPTLPQALTSGSLVIHPSVPDESGAASSGSAAEWRLTAERSGTFQLDPIIVAKGENRTAVPMPPLIVAPSSDETSLTAVAPTATLAWEIPAEPVIAGRAQTIALRVKPEGTLGEFQVSPTENSILERIETNQSESGIVAAFRLTPLASGEVILPRVEFHLASGETIESPELRVLASQAPHVEPRSVKTTPADTVVSTAATATAETAATAPIAGFPTIISTPGFPGLETQLALAGADWNQARYAESLARLRAYERDGSAWRQMRYFRRRADFALGLTDSADESAAPFWPLFGTIVSAFGIAVSAALGADRKRRHPATAKAAADLGAGETLAIKNPMGKVTSVVSGGFRIAVMIVALAIAAGAALRLASVRFTRRAITRTVAVYRIPDDSSGRTVLLPEGTAVAIRREINGWFYIAAADGSAGWIRSDRAQIF